MHMRLLWHVFRANLGCCVVRNVPSKPPMRRNPINSWGICYVYTHNVWENNDANDFSEVNKHVVYFTEM